MLKIIKTIVRFGIVGLGGVFVNLACFQICIFLSSPVWLASIGGFLAGASSNYTLHRMWTFKTKGNPLKSVIAALLALGISATVTTGTEHFWSILPALAQFLGILVSFPVNYLAHRHWVFEPLKEEPFGRIDS